jgi:hypothetical protein
MFRISKSSIRVFRVHRVLVGLLCFIFSSKSNKKKMDLQTAFQQFAERRRNLLEAIDVFLNDFEVTFGDKAIIGQCDELLELIETAIKKRR